AVGSSFSQTTSTSVPAASVQVAVVVIAASWFSSHALAKMAYLPAGSARWPTGSPGVLGVVIVTGPASLPELTALGPAGPVAPVGPAAPKSARFTAVSFFLQAVSRATIAPDFFLQRTAPIAGCAATPATTRPPATTNVHALIVPTSTADWRLTYQEERRNQAPPPRAPRSLRGPLTQVVVYTI